MRQVAIIGLAPSSFEYAPWDDPTWEKWGLPWGPRWYQLDRAFELHDITQVRRTRSPVDYEDRLRSLPCLYMQQAHYPNAIRFPLDEVSALVGDYFSSSIAYLLALAIHEGVGRIGLWGVDMSDNDEYAYQKANCEYLIGFARGKGIEVHIPEISPLCRFNSTTFPRRYGCLT